jgi:glutathione S-transferase
VTDLLQLVSTAYHEPDEARKVQKHKKLVEQDFPAQLAIFEDRLAKTGSGYLAASGLTFADFYLTLITDYLGDKKEVTLAQYPRVKKLTESVNSHPRIAAWIAKRPVSVL